MSAYKDLQKIQQRNRSMICLGLDLDPKRMPADFGGSTKGMFEYAHKVIDATSDLVCAYKPNLAFFEQLGPQGLSLLKLILDRVPEYVPVILDAKRGDIGNTSAHYAKALFDYYGADWVTVNPYMGHDSLRPFLEYKDKGIFVLCLTSNAGAKDFQYLQVNGKPLYMEVAEKVVSWNKDGNCGLVVGATHPEELVDIRAVSGDMPILIPGVGAQGGSLEEAVLGGTDNFRKPALINVARSVLYASSEADFAQRARQELLKLNDAVNKLRAESEKGQAQSRPIEQQPGPIQPESRAENAPPLSPGAPPQSVPQVQPPTDAGAGQPGQPGV
jgi:orotidine-5'-phosphate decarboxylase